MTKGDLVKALAQWPDESEIELAVDIDIEGEGSPGYSGEPVWFRLVEVEEINSNPKNPNLHCLLFGGEVTMK